MAQLSIRVLGPFQVSLAGEPVSGFASDKVRALLAYLALSPDRPHRRETLAGLLWPEFPERSARSSLRNALANLRHVLGERAGARDGAASPPFLHSTHQTIQFNGESDYWLDATVFEDLLAPVPATSAGLEQAVSLVRGPFLEGFSLADAAPFEEWLLLRREHLGRQVVEALDSLVAIYEGQGAYEQALVHARRRVELDPWQEEGQRQLMRLLARSGRRSEALAQYEKLCRSLQEELGAGPSAETTELHAQIREGELHLPAVAPAEVHDLEQPLQLPRFLEQETDAVKPPVFVARERQLDRLKAHLDEALAGCGHAVFVTGGPGRGKTALLAEFGRLATDAHPNLLVASGNCNAYSGVGDPYLPFREVMAMLTGDVEARWLAGTVSTTQARRLWNALPVSILSLLHHGPDVMGPLVSGHTLMSRAALWCATAPAGPQGAAWLHPLRQRVEHRQADPEGTEQSQLFQQVTDLLRTLADNHPLVLILDDLQWADAASISLLFHLGRRLQGTRILVAGAYRGEEVVLGRGGERHPLEKVLSELKRTYGDVWLDLAETGASERRSFVDALLDSEPNRLGEAFREELVRRAGGHPLFTVELVRAMQARGDLVHDDMGLWTEGPVLDWQTLPVRVEGAIEARIGRLEPVLRETLSLASVEGEDITVQVVAQVQGIEEGVLLRRLAQDLAMRHRLVVEQAEIQAGPRRFSRFRFSHALVQNYLYQQLSQGERRLLHGRVARALENCYGERVDEFAVQLAHHHSRAGDDGRALHFFTQAAENAHRVYANQEAHAHYTHAIEAAKRISADTASLIRLFLGRGRVSQRLGDFEEALVDYESALEHADGAGDREIEKLEWRALVDLGRLWTSRDYQRAHVCFRDALELSQRMGDRTLQAGSLNWLGNWYLNQENPRAAIEHHQEALEIFERLRDQRGLAATLDLLGIAALLGGNITAMVQYYDRAIVLLRELGDPSRLASSLTGRGHSGGSTYAMLTAVSPAAPTTPEQDLEEAARIARETGSKYGEAWVLWSLGLLYMVQGRFGQALEAAHNSLEISTQIGHLEGMVASRCVLGTLYTELLAPEEAQRHLETALTLAEELRSRVFSHWAAGALAAANFQLDDLIQAQACLETVLTSETPLDSMYARYCWARWAELALCQGNPALALETVERLSAAAPGMGPGRVITFLWKLKGEALLALGETEKARTLLQAAVDNARATGERFLLWHLHASMGRLYRASGRHPEAEEEVSTAHELVEGLADTIPDGEVREDFRQRAHERLRSSP